MPRNGPFRTMSPGNKPLVIHSTTPTSSATNQSQSRQSSRSTRKKPACPGSRQHSTAHQKGVRIQGSPKKGVRAPCFTSLANRLHSLTCSQPELSAFLWPTSCPGNIPPPAVDQTTLHIFINWLTRHSLAYSQLDHTAGVRPVAGAIKSQLPAAAHDTCMYD
jgi:hypothetical protein